MRVKSIVAGLILGVSILSAQVETTIEVIQSDRDPSTQASNWADSTVTVSGVITALTGVTGTRNIFIEMNPGGPWRGIMVYFPTSLGTLPSMNIGDSVLVTAGVLEYYGNTELQVNALTDFQIIQTGVTPPDPVVITCAHLDTTQTSDFPVDSAEAYEGVLVRIENAYVTRTGLGTNNEFEITDGTGYVIVRNNYSYTPNVGDAMNIQGIVETRTLSGVTYYMLRPRSIDDYEFLLPGVADIYSIDRNKVIINFKTPMDPSTAQDPAKYVIVDSATATPLNIISAEVSSENNKIVILTTEQMTDALKYKFYGQGLTDVYGQAITDTAYFYGGFTPITLIESDTVPNDSANGFRSNWDGRTVTITGIITGWKDKFAYPFFFVQQGEGPWTGIHGWDPNNFIPLSDMQEGDSVILVGDVLEYGTNAITELTNIRYYRVVSSGHTVNPVTVPLTDLRNEAGAVSEQWEHVLVAVEPPVFVYDVGTGGDWKVYEYIEPDTFVLNVEGDYAIGYSWRPTEVDQQIDMLVGILRYRGTLYPRTDADIVPSSVKESGIAYLKNSIARKNLEFTIPVGAGNVKAELYNVEGRKIMTLYEGKGKDEIIRIDVSNIRPGAYFLVVSSDGKVNTQKVVIVK
ncbi:MAG: T9SS type A sorting domain-containing protein [bacterium]|nr:T9SS type A sorting domain-containing protein [bacterium]